MMFAPLRKVTAPAASDTLAAWSPRSGRRIVKDHRGTDLTGHLDYEARLGAAHEEHLGFERLVADIAGDLAAAAGDAVGEAIDGALRRIGEGLHVDEAAIWRKTADSRAFDPLFSWARRPGTPRDVIPSASIPWIASRFDAGRIAAFARTSDVQSPSDREWFTRNGRRSMAVVPFAANGALVLGSSTREWEMTPAILNRLRLLASVISQAMARRTAADALSAAVEEVRTLRARLAGDPPAPRRDLRAIKSSRVIVAESMVIKRALAQAEQVAPTPATVLLLGETGSGKEVFAQAIHDLSPRHHRQMVKVSCAAIPAALIESELFGRERGAYTGALSRQIGRFEVAHQSTIFLDEIGELPAEVQVKLLRVIQERVIERLGSNQSVKVDVRIIAATNRNLEKAVEDKVFREDLFYRLNVFPIVVPPLRERVEDIPGLVWAFIDEISKSFGKSVTSISRESIRELQRYSWPGNVRELRNIIERAVILATGSELEVAAPSHTTRIPATAMTLVDLEVDHIRAVLESTNWRIRGAGGAAERLGLKPTTLESRMARFGLRRKVAAPGALAPAGV
jgi:formate hydrogenlyase transcriptional activator